MTIVFLEKVVENGDSEGVWELNDTCLIATHHTFQYSLSSPTSSIKVQVEGSLDGEAWFPICDVQTNTEGALWHVFGQYGYLRIKVYDWVRSGSETITIYYYSLET